MSAPRRWVDDPLVDDELRELLRGAPGTRPLDPLTRRRLAAKVARVSALPAAAAGWLFVKSAAAALGVVLGGGALAVSAGLVELGPRTKVETVAPAPVQRPAPARSAARVELPREVRAPEPAPSVANRPSLPAAPPIVSAAGTLSAEATLLERARREMRVAPALSLSIAAEHAERFPRGQLASERTLIQIEALHRLRRDSEARKLARGLLSGPSGDLYAERVSKLLGGDLAR
jgi:hypothetical protein